MPQHKMLWWAFVGLIMPTYKWIVAIRLPDDDNYVDVYLDKIYNTQAAACEDIAGLQFSGVNAVKWLQKLFWVLIRLIN